MRSDGGVGTRQWPLLRLVAVVALTIGLCSLPGVSPLEQASADTDAGSADADAVTVDAAAAPDPAHPYGHPVWYPLRSTDGKTWKNPPKPGTLSALIGCIIDNCQRAGRGGGHDHWALDLIGDQGDPVHAAGQGIFHVGGIAGCKEEGTPTRGTWGWIDHGGGIVSRYHHLDTVAVELDGKLVTPATQIGTLGHTGGRCGSINYLHFQVLYGGLYGAQATPYDPGQMRACSGGEMKLYPRDLGASSWDDLDYNDPVPVGDSSCVTGAATPQPPASTRARRGDSRVAVNWGAPAEVVPAVNGVAVVHQIWHPSTSAWGRTTYRTLIPEARKTTFKGLLNGRTYRFRVAYRNRQGYSSWGPWVQAVPAAPPDAPTFREISSNRERIIYRWWKPRHNGAPVTAYTTGIRRKTPSGWTRWSYTRVEDSLSYHFTGLRPGRTYQVRVRAMSGAGKSTWSEITRIRTLR